MPLTIGTQLGSHEITALLGKGGMGEVYRARDLKLKREVAIKILPDEFSRDADRVNRFQREAEVLASLNHPNIAAIYDVQEASGSRFLVLELVEGQTLADRIQSGRIPIEEAVQIAKNICEALEAAHEQGIVHRDLKPANIKVTPDGKVKVLDFGLAKATEPSPAATLSNSPTVLSAAMSNTGVILGTAAYMSPEQAKGRAVDKRADIWAFGVVLWEMLTGERLFQGETMTDVLAAVVTKEPDLNRTPLKLRRLLRRCLEKDPKRRLRDIGEVRFLLEEGETDARVQVPPPNKSLWAIPALLLALVALAFVHFRESPSPQPMMRFNVDLGPGAVASPRVTASISPDGRRLVFVSRGADGRDHLMMRLLDQANPTVIPETENATDPFFSADSLWIGFFADGKMKKVSVQGGGALALCDVVSARGASWGDDGYIIATLNSTSGTGLSRIPDSGGVPQMITSPADRGQASDRWPQVLPGNQSVLFTSSKVAGDYENGDIEVLSLKTGQVKVVARGGYFGRYMAITGSIGELVYVRQGILLGVPFDAATSEVRGSATPLLQDVAADAPTAAGRFDFSGNGTFIYLSGKTSALDWPLVWLDSSGKMEPLLNSPRAYYNPRLAPDGKRVAYSVSLKDIEVYDWTKDRTTRLTFAQQNQVNAHPVWAPDGAHIVFRNQSSEGFSLQWIRSDGAGESKQLLAQKGDIRPYSFSPDGRRLAFGAGGGQAGLDLWTTMLDLSDPDNPKVAKPELFLSTPFEEYEPAFSPDGRWIAYRTNPSGSTEVFVQPFPGPGGKWAIGAGRHPVWSRNGKELFYFGLDNRIMVTHYTSQRDSFVAEKSRVWSDTQILEPNLVFSNMDVAPDGKRFVISRRPDWLGGQKQSLEVTVMINFFDELRRIAPVSKK
jgi:serine/threonine-protein kinase